MAASLTALSREENVYLAKLAENGERYDEMLAFMRSVAQLGVEMTTEERNLFSVAWKNVTGARRSAMRIINAIADKAHDGSHAAATAEYCGRIEKELDTHCIDCLDTLAASVLPAHGSTTEGLVFFHKMAGDYNRYRCEYLKDEVRTAAVDEARRHYKMATEVAHRELSPTNAVRLGLALNYSVFLYEIEASASAACELAKSAFDDAIACLDTLDECCYKDSTLIMQLLRDNLTLWTSAVDEDEDEAM